MTNLNSTRYRVEQLRQKAYKDIGSNPFICQKRTWVDKLFGNPYSQAEIYKMRIDIMFDTHLANL